MAQSFPEKAHLHTDLKKYEENWERIFGKKEEKEEDSLKESGEILSRLVGGILSPEECQGVAERAIERAKAKADEKEQPQDEALKPDESC